MEGDVEKDICEKMKNRSDWEGLALPCMAPHCASDAENCPRVTVKHEDRRDFHPLTVGNGLFGCAVLGI